MLGTSGMKTTYISVPYTVTALVPTKSRIRIVHNVANGPEVDGLLDGNLVLRKVGYKATSDYLEVSSGKHTITVKISGTETMLIHGEINLENDHTYTMIVHGAISNVSSISSLILQDNLSCPQNNKAHVRFVHAAATVPAVDIYAGQTKVFSNVGYGQIGAPEYLPVASGPVELSVKVANTHNTVLGPFVMNLSNKGVYTIIASGLVNDSKSPIAALITEDTHGSCVILNL